MSNSDPRLQALHRFSPTSRSASRNGSRFGYGGISEKISRLNDILRNLDTRRSFSAHSGAKDGYPSVWPPPLYNSARLWETKTALHSHSVNMPDISGLPDEMHFAEGTDLVHHPAHVLRTQSAAQSGMLDNLARHCHSSAHPTTMQDRVHLGSTSSTPNRIPWVQHFYVHGNEGHNIGYDQFSYPTENCPFSVHKQQPLGKRSLSNFKTTNGQLNNFSERPAVTEDSGSPNLIDIGHAILARLDRLENQQEATSKVSKLHGPSKKGSACKVGIEQRLSMQKKTNFGEKGLLQMVRRRIKHDPTPSFERPDFSKNKNNSSQQKEQDEQIEKRFQRLENELEVMYKTEKRGKGC